MKKYSAKALAHAAGVSIRTLHYYDKIGLLKPALRTEANYRLYGRNELLKLQQIIFFRELDVSLKQIAEIIHNPAFDLVQALKSHASALKSKRALITEMLKTIDYTIEKIDNKQMITEEQLYKGFKPQEWKSIRDEAIKAHGKQKVEQSEVYLKSLNQHEFEELLADQKDIFKSLFALRKLEVDSEKVQLEVARHYTNTRAFWGTMGDVDTQKQAYKGLAKMYATDLRFTQVNGKEQPEFAIFLCAAMKHYANFQL